jgi:hypothetical protein
MGELVLFLSKAARDSMQRSDSLGEAVEHLAQVIMDISSSAEERAEWIKDAHWLLKEIVRGLESDASKSGGA